ncbi:peptidyl-tRNA hydrolase [Histoplasma capsulatum H143]|uniref:peptidyl-tRNA hydrolase n=1 Tax=Ajellomyces capsulatus (strain H143) TaxID=544712 RepID=C6H2K3_AJECH|nr:peptidyl-tRNA hydrolase [Histoplasma capsulatum H143]
MTSLPAATRVPPSTTALVIATAILAGVVGFFIGQGASLGVFGSGSGSRSASASVSASARGGGRRDGKEKWSDEDEEGSEAEESDGRGELAAFEGNTEEVKLVLVVRTDLGMGKGKIAAQCSHATLACYKYYLTRAPDSPILKRWERGGQAKVALQVRSEEELLVLQAQAVSLGLCAQVIQDAGRTQVASGSLTVLGILGPKGVVDGVTGSLKLL